MIDNCKDCKTKCCSIGPGPYKLLTPEQFLANHGEFEGYNTQCKMFILGMCTAWNSDYMPLECKTYVCQVRSFSKSELKEIAKLSGRK